MPVIKGQGHSAATRAKQYALKTSLGYILGPAVAIAKRYCMPCVVADMTAGRGVDEWGHDGSPLILAEAVTTLERRFKYPVAMIFTERRRLALDELCGVVSERYPTLVASYVRDQRAAVAAIPPGAFGLMYFDPNRYNATARKPDGLDADLLASVGRSHTRVDILITRECLSTKRMWRAAHCPGTLTIQDYLALTGKRRQFILPYADYHWWTLGFASNWTDPAIAKRQGWVDVQGPQGPAVYAKWTKGMELNIVARDTQGELPWGA